MHRVFVYGTLKRGEPNHHAISEAAGSHHFVDTGRTVTFFPMMVSSQINVPILLAKPGEGKRIFGEVYEVDNEKLKILDEMEAYPSLYDRPLEKIELSDGTFTEAHVYMLKRWRPDIYERSSALLDNYSSNGDHGRPFSRRFKRATDAIGADGYDIINDICGKI